jgi:hypothetical protein
MFHSSERKAGREATLVDHGRAGLSCLLGSSRAVGERHGAEIDELTQSLKMRRFVANPQPLQHLVERAGRLFRFAVSAQVNAAFTG